VLHPISLRLSNRAFFRVYIALSKFEVGWEISRQFATVVVIHIPAVLFVGSLVEYILIILLQYYLVSRSFKLTRETQHFQPENEKYKISPKIECTLENCKYWYFGFIFTYAIEKFNTEF